MKISRRLFLESVGMGAAGEMAASLWGGMPGAQAVRRHAAAAWTPPPVISNPNILFIIVDQLRYPQWLSGRQLTVYQEQLIPNITQLIANRSYAFDQYYTAATVCSAARATLLSGLYAPQSGCYTETNEQYLLLPVYWTWGDAIASLNPAYANNVWWFGKWHLSRCTGSTPLVPYGFQTRTYPGGAIGNPDPEGVSNEGTNGGPFEGKTLARDSEIAGDFIGWITGQAPTIAPTTPWCATVSLINPHDIANAPKFNTTYFPKPAFPPPGSPPSLMNAIPSPWNWENLSDLPQKPPLQLAFQENKAQNHGTVIYPDGWVTFLNDYYWLQNYVDTQIGLVLEALANSPYAGNTIILFTADHGEYGGSHGLHDKGDAAYDESIRVPLYVGFPGQTNTIAMRQMCSSVDMFGFLCDLATGGSGQWRTAYPNVAHRQSIWDFLYHNSSETRLCAALGNIPYIFHTCDETSADPADFNAHIVCLRTKNTPEKPGAKYCTYSHWDPCEVVPDIGYGQDFEFYDYDPAATNNTYETGNDYFSSDPMVQQDLANYVAALGVWTPEATGLIAAELARPLVGTGKNGKLLTNAQQTAQENYFKYLGNSCTA